VDHPDGAVAVPEAYTAAIAVSPGTAEDVMVAAAAVAAEAVPLTPTSEIAT
jgi:hypothetical protein